MADINKNKSALKVNEGVNQPPSVNENSAKKFKVKKRKQFSVKEITEGIKKSNRIVLSRAITLIESSLPEHQVMAQQIIESCLPHSGKSIRIGITGVPGAGKSTFIEAFGEMLTENGHKLAVLAIDPSSERSKGSILGDKTRMEKLSTNENAYIRPSPSAGSLGGVARKTRESIILCEAAGFDVILIETVGVGQSETAVHSMVDFFLLLMLAGAGDELQGIKRGIMEMADTIVINKTDGDNINKAEQARVQIKNALHLFPATMSGWIPTVQAISSINKNGIAELWKTILDYKQHTLNNGYFIDNRQQQSKYWMHQTINEQLQTGFYQNSEIAKKITTIEKQVLENKISSFEAARQLLNIYLK